MAIPVTALQNRAGPTWRHQGDRESDDGPFYLAAESTDFSLRQPAASGRSNPAGFRLAASLLSSDPGLDLDIWVVQYNGQKRLVGIDPASGLAAGALIDRARDQRSQSGRAIRRSRIHLGPLGLTDESSDGAGRANSPTTQRGGSLATPVKTSSSFSALEIGDRPSPIAEHPACAAATVDNLALRERQRTSKQRLQRGARIHRQPAAGVPRLGQRSSGDVIVGKHRFLLYTDRIRRVFPEAASCSLIATLLPSSTRCSTLAGQDRGGRGTGRKCSCSAMDAIREAADRCCELHQPIQIAETLVEDTSDT